MFPVHSDAICRLLGIKFPMIQAGMVWTSGGKLAAASANAGCLGLVGAGSMNVALLRAQIQKARKLSRGSIGVNLPLLYHGIEAQIECCLEEGIKIFFTSAGSPKKFTAALKKQNCVVVHVTSTIELAFKCQDAGVDAVVLEGFEAGGHNGRDELTTLVLLQQAMGQFDIPIIAAGGIGTGAGVFACLGMGASAVQIGTAFALTAESSCHPNFKQRCFEAGATETELMMKQTVPVRLLRNRFSQAMKNLESQCATAEQTLDLLGHGRAKLGILDGDLNEGELEIGQIVSVIKKQKTCQELVDTLVAEYQRAHGAMFDSASPSMGANPIKA